MLEKNLLDLFNTALELRADGALRHRDLTVLIALINWLNFDNFIDVKNKRVVNKTDLDKSDISKSIKSLKNCGIILESEDGFKLNNTL